MTYLTELVITGLFTLIAFTLFYVKYRACAASMWNGFLFTIFLAGCGVFAIVVSIQFPTPLLLVPMIILLFIAASILSFGLYALVVFFLMNAKTMFKRERRSLANSLTLVAGILLLLYIILSFLFVTISIPLWLQMVWSVLSFIFFCYLLYFFCFVVSLLLAKYAHCKKDKDYIVILGSGLIHGKVPPLLASRINKALEFREKQQIKTGKVAKLVVSGGQGKDEPLSEAQAMAEYILTKGVPEGQILKEDKSASTYQNLLFSKEIMEKDFGGEGYTSTFSTNGYHVFRAGLYAKKVGLPTRGLAAKTAFYYAINATLREYLAYLKMRFKFHLIITGLVFLLGLILMVAVSIYL